MTSRQVNDQRLETAKVDPAVPDRIADDADLTIKIDLAELETVMMGQTTFMAQIDYGTAQPSGDTSVLEKLAATLVQFDLGFEIMPGFRHLPLSVLRDEIDEEFWVLSSAHYDRYIATSDLFAGQAQLDSGS